MNNMPSQNDDRDSSVGEYLSRAAAAVAQGNQMLALHLYLAAFERGQAADDSVPTEAAIDGLKRAWCLACSLKERSIAEYVFERMEPYLSSDEVAACAEQLQELALSKLEEFGLSRDELEDMTDMISQVMEYQAFTNMPRTVLTGVSGITVDASNQDLPTLILDGTPGRAIPSAILTDEVPNYFDSVGGAGFDPAGVGPTSHGLAGMRHRVEAAGGRLTITSSADSGTLISAVLPKPR